MPKSKLDKPEERLCFALYSTAQSITNSYQPYLSDLGMTYTQYIVYITLESEIEMSIGELSDSLFLDPATISPLLKRMEKIGMVTRIRDQKDERKVFVKLTPKARKLKAKIIEIQYQVACNTGLNSIQRKSIIKELHKLNQHIRSHNSDK